MSLILGIISGFLGGYTFKIFVDARRIIKNNHSQAIHGTVTQQGNTAGGHIAGGNINASSK